MSEEKDLYGQKNLSFSAGGESFPVTFNEGAFWLPKPLVTEKPKEPEKKKPKQFTPVLEQPYFATPEEVDRLKKQ
ncbi:MAG: hypothetical protein LBT20_08820 [Clostridiales bacterium]|jgi:hypothetical protein|nr:hypothetical protein [Clostridiales bacterium]